MNKRQRKKKNKAFLLRQLEYYSGEFECDHCRYRMGGILILYSRLDYGCPRCTNSLQFFSPIGRDANE